ncbi:MAG TPA: response regulator transcription factor [bacterium]|nr:response regulator transcription factor [bacterium]
MSVRRTLIVDDSALARRAIRNILERSSQFEVIAEATNGLEAIARARELMPELVLMDLRMPRLDGLGAIQAIKEEFPSMQIVVLSVSDDPRDLFEAIKRGAQGYLIKNMEPQLWLEYLDAIVSGDARISRTIAERVLQEFTWSRKPDLATTLPMLTARERDILTLVTRGQTNREIGMVLDIAENTVRRHLQNILEKLHLRNRVELAAFATRHDMGQRKR